ncbi:TetR/AcrR family transcriptional regulator [Streptacidiphilus pinicola]|uniref:TetR/AcrR family transcriptional regulator n=1 Tax=Streptacidiphilus pinicola TaxID=2219663 RepID=A0A2X0KHE0_9ACTN|nr:TetR/AcrR family transcriptional regulator [Streptacidiphilus pinicola]RAG86499.1 TetR/AcrR family transcriptional regulator [Streptacidiphilus pinicola]
MVDTDLARERILDAAEDLFYAQGIQAVGMDVIRDAAGVTLRRLYQLFPSKGDLLGAYLARRDTRWLHSVTTHVDASARTPQERVLAVFDWLEDWFTQPDYHGCAFVNSFGELGGTSPQVVAAARHHKDAFHAYLQELTTAAGAAADVGAQIALLAEGAMTTAAISGTPAPARQAKKAARLLLTLETGHPTGV